MLQITRSHAPGILVSLALAVATIGCASTPKVAQTTIDEARQAIQQAESSPLAGEVAAKELDDAHAALREAESLAKKHRSGDKIANAAYAAKRHAQIAQEQIATAAAKKDAERAEAERQAVLLQAREREARIKERQADQAREEAVAATREAQEIANEAKLQAEQERERAAQLDRELQQLNAKKTERGYVLTLGDVLFDTGKATLKPGALASMDRLSAFLKEADDRKVVIEGHTDSVGSEDYNLELSQRRADAVQSALLSRGVPTDRVTAVGKGKGYPVASNDSAGGRQQNRRVEIIIDNPERTSANLTPRN